MKALSRTYNAIPVGARPFLLRAIIIFVCWNVLYVFFLAPKEVPDQFLSAFTGKCAVAFLNFFTEVHWQYDYYDHGAFVLLQYAPIVKVMHSCNALELYILYTGFFICLPLSVKRIVLFIAVGVLLIFTVNVLRIAGVAWLHYIHSSWVDFNHKVIFKAVVYALVLFLWYTYVREKKSTNR